MADGTEQLRAELVRAAHSLGAPDGVEPVLERPRDPSFGDWATNVAMVLAKPLDATCFFRCYKVVRSVFIALSVNAAFKWDRSCEIG